MSSARRGEIYSTAAAVFSVLEHPAGINEIARRSLPSAHVGAKEPRAWRK